MNLLRIVNCLETNNNSFMFWRYLYVLKGKPLDEYKGFSYRLVKVAIEKGIEDTRELADALYENAECKNAITIRKTQKKNPDDPLKI